MNDQRPVVTDEHEIVEFEGVDTRLTLGRVLLGAIVLASFGTWAYAYSGLADREPPDTLDEPSFGMAAEAICAAAQKDIGELPNALDAVDARDRAEQIRAIDVRYTQMLDELDELLASDPTRSERDVGIIETWLARWRVIVSDREDYANRLEADPAALFYLSEEAGRRAERSLSFVADNNGMASCGAPGDLG